jgi:hypothetical protein
MLQVTHRMDKLITTSQPDGRLVINDQSITTSMAGGNTQIWLLLDQAVLNGHSYEAFLVLHDERGELHEMRLTNPAAVPAVIEN